MESLRDDKMAQVPCSKRSAIGVLVLGASHNLNPKREPYELHILCEPKLSLSEVNHIVAEAAL